MMFSVVLGSAILRWYCIEVRILGLTSTMLCFQCTNIFLTKYHPNSWKKFGLFLPAALDRLELCWQEIPNFWTIQKKQKNNDITHIVVAKKPSVMPSRPPVHIKLGQSVRWVGSFPCHSDMQPNAALYLRRPFQPLQQARTDRTPCRLQQCPTTTVSASPDSSVYTLTSGQSCHAPLWSARPQLTFNGVRFLSVSYYSPVLP